MAMPSSGKITLFDARTELGLSGKISLQQSEVRTLFAVPSGAISLFDGYGKGEVSYPVWVGAGTPVSGSGASLYSISSTTTVVGDLLVMAVTTTANSTASSVTAGWTLLKRLEQTVGSLLLYYKFATSDGASNRCDINLVSSAGFLATMYTFRGATDLATKSSGDASTNVTSIPIQQLLATKNKVLLVCFSGSSNSTAQTTNPTVGTVADWAKNNVTTASTVNYRPTCCVFTKQLATSGISSPGTSCPISPNADTQSIVVQLASY